MATACALTMYRTGRPIPECVAVLQLARNRGLDDNQYLAAYGGLLTLDGKLSEANGVWTRARASSAVAGDRERIVFEIADGQEPKWLEGRLVTLTPRFGFARVSGLPDVFCPAKLLRGAG